MKRTSLDDFVAADRTTASGAADEEPARNADPGHEPSDESGGDRGAAEDATDDRPALTAAWSADAETCAACGDATAWRWAQSGTLVCPACKEW